VIEPEDLEGETIENVDVNSTWEAELGEGCELAVTLDGGATLFVIRTGLDSAEEEIEAWRTEHTGVAVEDTREITSIPLETGGLQTTIEVTLDDGLSFEGDLMQGVDRVDEDPGEMETEWTFEGQPGVEMGDQETGDPDNA
jgi:hypothetical protein